MAVLDHPHCDLPEGQNSSGTSSVVGALEAFDGEAVGALVGYTVSPVRVGDLVGATLGAPVAGTPAVGELVGYMVSSASVGCCVGAAVGITTFVGVDVGYGVSPVKEGALVGTIVGEPAAVGEAVG